MANTQSARSGQSNVIPFGVFEARERIKCASHSFHALMTLLKNSSVSPAPEDLYYLLQPISGEVDAAFDELRVVKDGDE